MKGRLFLIPGFIAETAPAGTFPANNTAIVNEIRYFIVEDLRTARRTLKKMNPDFPIDECSFKVIEKHEQILDFKEYLQPAIEGKSIGLLSEAGVPCVADPGSLFVRAAHELDIKVIPLVGPSSILLALMASGLNGQNFAFNGYLDIKPEQRIANIRKLEERAYRENQSQLFIETPYRNHALLDSLLKTCKPTTLLTIGCEIMSPGGFVLTKKIQEWSTSKIPDLNKKTVIFALGK